MLEHVGATHNEETTPAISSIMELLTNLLAPTFSISLLHSRPHAEYTALRRKRWLGSLHLHSHQPVIVDVCVPTRNQCRYTGSVAVLEFENANIGLEKVPMFTCAQFEKKTIPRQCTARARMPLRSFAITHGL